MGNIWQPLHGRMHWVLTSMGWRCLQIPEPFLLRCL